MRRKSYTNKKLVFFFITVLCVLLLFDQDTYSQTVNNTDQKGNPSQQPKASIKDRLYFGGNLGIQFGTITLINVSPVVGLSVSDRFDVGVGLTYQFYQDNNPYYGNRYRSHMFGGRGYARYYVFRDLFVQGEYELLNFDALNTFGDTDRVTVHSYFIGGGYRQWIGQKAFMSVVVLWNLNENPYYPYSNPIFRIGAGFGF